MGLTSNAAGGAGGRRIEPRSHEDTKRFSNFEWCRVSSWFTGPSVLVEEQIPNHAHRDERGDRQEDRDREHCREAGPLAVKDAFELAVAGVEVVPHLLEDLRRRV